MFVNKEAQAFIWKTKLISYRWDFTAKRKKQHNQHKCYSNNTPTIHEFFRFLGQSQLALLLQCWSIPVLSLYSVYCLERCWIPYMHSWMQHYLRKAYPWFQQPPLECGVVVLCHTLIFVMTLLLRWAVLAWWEGGQGVGGDFFCLFCLFNLFEVKTGSKVSKGTKGETDEECGVWQLSASPSISWHLS